MSKSSLASNRLVHISDLPNSQHYTTSSIITLLPIHYSTLRDNLLAILFYEAENFTDKILVHDPELNIYSDNYQQVRGGWCQDIDQDNINSSNHVANSIQIAVVVLNYLHAITKAKNNKSTLPQNKDNKIISKGESITSTKTTSLGQLLSTSKLSTLQSSQKTQYEPLNMQINSQRVQNNSNLVISYNIYKKSKKYIFLTGFNSSFNKNIYSSTNLYRNWNFTRLSINKTLQLTYNKLSRIDIYIEHLFSILRGFITQYHSNFSSTELNSKKAQLKQLLECLQFQKDLLKQQQYVFSIMSNKQPQIYQQLDDILKLYRFSFTYKLNNMQSDQYAKIIQSFHNQFANILTFLIQNIPINIPISYHFQCIHNQQTNQLYLYVLFNYKSASNLTLLNGHSFLNDKVVGSAMKNLSNFLNKQSFQMIQKNQQNTADQVFQSSYRIFHKYSQNLSGSNLSGSKAQLIAKDEQYEDKFYNLKASTRSLFDTELLSKKGSLSRFTYRNTLQSGTKRSQSSLIKLNLSQSASKSVLFSKNTGDSLMQVQYKNLLKSIHFRQQNANILNPKQIYTFVNAFLEPFDIIHRNNALSNQEKFSLFFVGKVCSFLSPQDIAKLIQRNQDFLQAITDFFMQEHNYQKMIEVGKILSRNIQPIFQSYIQSKNDFRHIRYHLLINYCKKILQIYYLKSYKQSWIQKSPQKTSPNKSIHKLHNLQQSIIDGQSFVKQSQININLLIYILQKNNFNSQQYKTLVHNHLQQIFNNRVQTKYISTILEQFYLVLIRNGHHQDLVTSFVADLYFQIVYFSKQTTNIMLNNSYYRKDKLNLRQKKLYQLIRQGGFIYFGYQLNTIIQQKLFIQKPIINYHSLIVTTIRILSPNYFKNVLKIISSANITEKLTILSKQIKKHQQQFNRIDKQVCIPFYSKQLLHKQDSQFELGNNQMKQDIQQPLTNIQKSQSGIFQQLIQLNPLIRIGGKSIKQQYEKRLQQIQKYQQKFTTLNFIQNILFINLQQSWQYIQLSLLLEDKLHQIQKINNHRSISSGSKSVENDILYIKETIQHVYSKLSKIYQYLAFSDVLYQCQSLTQLN